MAEQARRDWRAMAALAGVGLLLAGCGTLGGRRADTADAGWKVGKPYQVGGRWYRPAEDAGYDRRGLASWYGPGHQGRPTASGETFDQARLTAAHTTLPIPSMVEVTNLDNGRRLLVRLNDRGPFVEGRIIDLSKAAADKLGFLRQGVAKVRVRFVGPVGAPGRDGVRLAGR